MYNDLPSRYAEYIGYFGLLCIGDSPSKLAKLDQQAQMGAKYFAKIGRHIMSDLIRQF